MSKEKRRVPKLRFPGFTEDWEQRKFGEIYERASQKNDLTYGIDKIISVANMYFKIDATVGSEEYLKTYNVFKLGDIAFEGHTNKEYSYGRFVENTIGDGIVSHIFDVFTPRINLDINFWKDLIKYEPIMGPILRRCTKASRMMSNLTSKEFLEEKILCPTLEEQKLIGEFIVRIDKNITLHQRKLEHLNLKKKALLQKLFPKNGERYPELRFPGFADAWEQRKFSEITYLSGIKNKENKPYESYSISNEFGFIPQNEQFEHGGTMKTADKSMYYIVTQNSFAYNPARINVGSIGYYDKPDNVIVSSLYEVFKTTEIVNDKFLWHWFKSNQFNHLIEKYQEGGVRLYFYYDKLCKGAIELPTIDEQNKISNLLNGLDLFITLHQRKLEHLQLQKKALLQQLFI